MVKKLLLILFFICSSSSNANASVFTKIVGELAKEAAKEVARGTGKDVVEYFKNLFNKNPKIAQNNKNPKLIDKGIIESTRKWGISPGNLNKQDIYELAKVLKTLDKGREQTVSYTKNDHNITLSTIQSEANLNNLNVQGDVNISIVKNNDTPQNNAITETSDYKGYKATYAACKDIAEKELIDQAANYKTALAACNDKAITDINSLNKKLHATESELANAKSIKCPDINIDNFYIYNRINTDNNFNIEACIAEGKEAASVVDGTIKSVNKQEVHIVKGLGTKDGSYCTVNCSTSLISVTCNSLTKDISTGMAARIWSELNFK